MGAPAGCKKSSTGGEEEVVALARGMGVSPRRLRGWEPATVTTFIYEGDRLVRAVTVAEPEFSDDDLALLRGHLVDERVPRGDHGFPLSEAMSPDADPSRLDGKYRFVAGLPSTDFAAQALAQAQDEYRKTYPDADLSALRWGVKRVER